MEGSGSVGDVGNGAAQSYRPAGAKHRHKKPSVKKIDDPFVTRNRNLFSLTLHYVELIVASTKLR
jgi:hypothetical protein